LGRSVAGIFVSTVLLGIWATGFVHGFQTARQNRQGANAVMQAAAEVHNDAKKEVTEKGAVGPESGQARVEKMKSAFDQAAKGMTGDDALVAKAGSAFVAKMQILQTNYATAARALKSPAVLDMKSVEQREQLLPKKEAVTKFMEANEKLVAFFTGAENILREELARVKVPRAAADAALKGYRQTAEERNFLVVKIRMTDQRIGAAMLGMLDLLDTSWGKWNYNPEKKKVIFQDTAVLAKYNGYYNDMNSAATEQAQLQGELVNLPATASAR
jgi:hypothetical protein